MGSPGREWLAQDRGPRDESPTLSEGGFKVDAPAADDLGHIKDWNELFNRIRERKKVFVFLSTPTIEFSFSIIKNQLWPTGNIQVSLHFQRFIMPTCLQVLS